MFLYQNTGLVTYTYPQVWLCPFYSVMQIEARTNETSVTKAKQKSAESEVGNVFFYGGVLVTFRNLTPPLSFIVIIEG